ncbi:hypothetical protein [Metabacillus litoralis]|uniref:hypothetical protein n=1 Tax=Metabacillus litoralis TaxID=152268 RepID=UPI001CFD70A0|nr:hypothetical protein [Metabacillus litoralis]
MMFISLLPIVIILFLIFVAFQLNKVISNTGIYEKLNLRWLLGLYAVVLFLSVCLFYLFPFDIGSKNVVDNKKEILNAQSESDALLTAALEGKKISEENLKGVLTREELNIPFEHNELEIFAEEQHGSNIVLVERKSTDDQKINVTQYYTRAILGNIEVTEEIKPYIVELNENTLSIMYPEPLDIQVGKFAKEFTITQFTGEAGLFDTMNDDLDARGESVIYVKVPKDVKIIDPSESFIYVN